MCNRTHSGPVRKNSTTAMSQRVSSRSSTRTSEKLSRKMAATVQLSFPQTPAETPVDFHDTRTTQRHTQLQPNSETKIDLGTTRIRLSPISTVPTETTKSRQPQKQTTAAGLYFHVHDHCQLDNRQCEEYALNLHQRQTSASGEMSAKSRRDITHVGNPT